MRKPDPKELLQQAAGGTQIKGMATTSSGVPSGKRSKRTIYADYDPAVHEQFAVLAAQKGISKKKLLSEALNDLFAKNGLPEIVE